MVTYLLSYIIGLICWKIIFLHTPTLAPLTSITLSSFYLGWNSHPISFKNILLLLMVLALSLLVLDYMLFGPKTYTTWAGSGEVLDSQYYIKSYNPFILIPLGFFAFYLNRLILLSKR